MRLLNDVIVRGVTAGPADDELVIAISRHDVEALRSAAREALEEVDEWEFHSRLGVTPEDMRALGRGLAALLQEAGPADASPPV